MNYTFEIGQAVMLLITGDNHKVLDRQLTEDNEPEYKLGDCLWVSPVDIVREGQPYFTPERIVQSSQGGYLARFIVTIKEI